MGVGLLSGILSGGYYAAAGALSGATGAAVLTATGYSGHIVSEVARVTAVGSGLVSAILGLIVGVILAILVSFDMIHISDFKRLSITKIFVITVIDQIVGSMIGYSIFKMMVTMMFEQVIDSSNSKVDPDDLLRFSR